MSNYRCTRKGGANASPVVQKIRMRLGSDGKKMMEKQHFSDGEGYAAPHDPQKWSPE